MKAALRTVRTAWAARSPRERLVLVALAALLGCSAYLLIMRAADRGREQLTARLAVLRVQAARLERQAAEHERLRAAPAASTSPGDLRSLVQARTDAAHLTKAVTRLDALDANHVYIAFGAVSFADWLAWAATLQSERVRIEGARVEALSAPGMVSAAATLTRSGAP